MIDPIAAMSYSKMVEIGAILELLIPLMELLLLLPLFVPPFLRWSQQCQLKKQQQLQQQKHLCQAPFHFHVSSALIPCPSQQDLRSGRKTLSPSTYSKWKAKQKWMFHGWFVHRKKQFDNATNKDSFTLQNLRFSFYRVPNTNKKFPFTFSSNSNLQKQN